MLFNAQISFTAPTLRDARSFSTFTFESHGFTYGYRVIPDLNVILIPSLLSTNHPPDRFSSSLGKSF